MNEVFFTKKFRLNSIFCNQTVAEEESKISTKKE